MGLSTAKALQTISMFEKNPPSDIDLLFVDDSPTATR